MAFCKSLNISATQYENSSSFRFLDSRISDTLQITQLPVHTLMVYKMFIQASANATVTYTTIYRMEGMKFTGSVGKNGRRALKEAAQENGSPSVFSFGHLISFSGAMWMTITLVLMPPQV